MRVLVLGSSGMLGNAVLRVFAKESSYEVLGTVRSLRSVKHLPCELQNLLLPGVDVENTDSLLTILGQVKPNIVINCVGLVKQLLEADDPLSAIPINSLLPHRLARICSIAKARLIHVSTDCVFSGSRGMYSESDTSDAKDLYGRSKFLGEVDYPHAITLRTSIIGHELQGSRSLIGWFLSQEGQVKGFKKAIFSGLPTVELARVIRDYVIPHPDLCGLYHVSAEPINKFDLLSLVSRCYGMNINIIPDENFTIDRSLDSNRFRAATGFQPKPWNDLIQAMKEFG